MGRSRPLFRDMSLRDSLRFVTVLMTALVLKERQRMSVNMAVNYRP
jgi:hypothetical protein